MSKIPEPPPTPPRGGAQYVLGKNHKGEERTLVDIGSVLERTADKVEEMYQEWPEIKALALTMPRVEAKLDVALRPTITPSYIRFATVAAAAAMLVSSIALVALVVLLAHSPSASAAVQTVPGAQASNRMAAPAP